MNLPCLPQKRLTLFLASPLRPFWVPLPRFRVANYGLRIELGGTRREFPERVFAQPFTRDLIIRVAEKTRWFTGVEVLEVVPELCGFSVIIVMI